MKIQKAWGTTEKIFETNSSSSFAMFIAKGGYCSEHFHKTKMNGFYVYSGELELTTWNEHGEEKKTILRAGDSMTVDIYIWHTFLALTDVVAEEYYKTVIQDSDIERRTIGGNVGK